MKVLFVEYNIAGHHHIYLHNLVNSTAYDSAVCIRQRDEVYECPVHYSDLIPEKNLKTYLAWLDDVRIAADTEHADIVMFMEMDGLMKYFGIGLNKLKKYRIVLVHHHYWPGFAREIAYRCIDRHADATVVHTAENRKCLEACRVGNVHHFEYPAFGKQHDNVPLHTPRKLLAFGATRYDKGLDILLEALKGMRASFHLEIVGHPGRFDKAFIAEHTQSYADRVSTDMRFVNEEEKDAYFAGTDIIVLPYRREFDGASGPLAEGVNQRKMIVGPAHGSLGRIIAENHLGYTFESENPESLRKVLEAAVKEDYVYDGKAEAYRDSLSPDYMRNAYEALFRRIASGGYRKGIAEGRR
ncbi:MAG: glycosyltransferase [Solobacterium sp.]|nr:glycosyltransferase [Solobacterium sp.]